MNIEIANRLVKLRKEKGLSQEELADRLGLSRQAVSKWERAEASPDTDNLICLAKIYGVSLDELLKTEDDEKTIIEEQIKTDKSEDNEKENTVNESAKAKEKVHIGLDGIHVIDEDGTEVRIDTHGIFVNDIKKGEEVRVGEKGIHINNKDVSRHSIDGIISGVTFALATFLYITFGLIFPSTWAYGWILFLLVPLAGTLPDSIRKKSFTTFAYPILVILIYFFLCMMLPSLGVIPAMWHPLWVIFLTIPVYYAVFGPIDDLIRRHRDHKNIIKEDYIDVKEE